MRKPEGGGERARKRPTGTRIGEGQKARCKDSKENKSKEESAESRGNEIILFVCRCQEYKQTVQRSFKARNFSVTQSCSDQIELQGPSGALSVHLYIRSADPAATLRQKCRAHEVIGGAIV